MIPVPATRSSGTAAAILVAGLMIAHQVAGRAVRDALFLSVYDVTSLPVMVMTAAAASILWVLGGGRLFARLGPARIVPAGFALSAVLHVAEWGLAALAVRAIAVAVYLHTAVLGIFLISSFWSLVTERFDPRTARRRIGRITAGATLGGLAGGLVAARLGDSVPVTTLLPFLAVLHLGAAATALRFLAGTASAQRRSVPEPGGRTPRFGLGVLRESAYLRRLALLAVGGTVAAALLDYTFKAAAVDAFPGGAHLLRFFALYHTGVSVGAFLVQSSLSRLFLEKLGIAPTAASLPLAVFGLGIPAAILPGLPLAVGARGTEGILRNSLYRSAYELHYTPVPRSSKRAAKALIDVAGERLGDGIGGGLVQLVLLAAPFAALRLLPALAAAIGLALAAVVVPRLRRGYVETLEENLLRRAPDLDLDEPVGSGDDSTILKSLTGLRLKPEVMAAIRRQVESAPAPAAPAPPADPLLERIRELRSRDRGRVRAVLDTLPTLDPALVPHVIPLLAWDDVAEEAAKSLVRSGPRIAGQLVDAFLDPRGELAVRRRLPRVLAEIGSPMVAGCLFKGLSDRRFEVRLQSGRALGRLVAAGVPSPATPEEIFAVVLREVEVDRKVWEGRRLLASRDEGGDSLFVDEVLKRRGDRSLEHVFTLLSLTLPREPLRVAFRGLHTQDPVLRGTALEYLESVLPPEIRARLWPFLEEPAPPRHPSRPAGDVLESLLQSNESIRLHLAELRDLKEGPRPPDPPRRDR